jgi:molybdopterin converting factor small subunit
MNIKFIGWISSLAGKREMDINLRTPEQLKNILPPPLQEKENIIIIVNNEPATTKTIVSNKDQVILMPIISGG